MSYNVEKNLAANNMGLNVMYMNTGKILHAWTDILHNSYNTKWRNTENKNVPIWNNLFCIQQHGVQLSMKTVKERVINILKKKIN